MSILEKDTQARQQLLTLLDLIETEESIIGGSAHIMGIAKKKRMRFYFFETTAKYFSGSLK